MSRGLTEQQRRDRNKCAGCDHIQFAHVRGPDGPYCWTSGGCDCTTFVPRFGTTTEPDT